jgi:hypothetical protein
VAPSSDFPTDHRRSDNHSESHQPWTLRTRCIADSMDPSRASQAVLRTQEAEFPPTHPTRGKGRLPRNPPRFRGQRKCTEPVAPSSGFPTDRRRSDCRSESHQPRTLRTRCIADSMRPPRARQAAARRTCRKLRSFLFTSGRTATTAVCSRSQLRRKRAGHVGPAARVRRAGNAFVHLPDEPSASA